MPQNYIFIKLDFINAFNTLRRVCMLEAVAEYAPEILHFVDSAYSTPSALAFGEYTVESAEGAQQGDPLGPLLVCLTIHKLLAQLS